MPPGGSWYEARITSPASSMKTWPGVDQPGPGMLFEARDEHGQGVGRVEVVVLRPRVVLAPRLGEAPVQCAGQPTGAGGMGDEPDARVGDRDARCRPCRRSTRRRRRSARTARTSGRDSSRSRSRMNRAPFRVGRTMLTSGRSRSPRDVIAGANRRRRKTTTARLTSHRRSRRRPAPSRGGRLLPPASPESVEEAAHVAACHGPPHVDVAEPPKPPRAGRRDRARPARPLPSRSMTSATASSSRLGKPSGAIERPRRSHVGIAPRAAAACRFSRTSASSPTAAALRAKAAWSPRLRRALQRGDPGRKGGFAEEPLQRAKRGVLVAPEVVAGVAGVQRAAGRPSAHPGGTAARVGEPQEQIPVLREVVSGVEPADPIEPRSPDHHRPWHRETVEEPALQGRLLALLPGLTPSGGRARRVDRS